jgi:hypothetical protein
VDGFLKLVEGILVDAPPAIPGMVRLTLPCGHLPALCWYHAGAWLATTACTLHAPAPLAQHLT